MPPREVNLTHSAFFQAMALLKHHKTTAQALQQAPQPAPHAHWQQASARQVHEEAVPRRPEYCSNDGAGHLRQSTAWPSCPQPASPPSAAACDPWLGRDAAARLAAAAAASRGDHRAMWEWMSGGAPLQSARVAGMDSF